ncbi:MAG: hypothetical protein LDL41_17465 [Coleofasciculus sp. S288]|nr:hypothetical protein [Coleofasciculus sp. S288]
MLERLLLAMTVTLTVYLCVGGRSYPTSVYPVGQLPTTPEPTVNQWH